MPSRCSGSATSSPRLPYCAPMLSSFRGSPKESSAGSSRFPSSSCSAKRRRSSSLMVANSRPRFFAMRFTPGGGLEQGLQSPEILVHFGSGIRSQQLDHCLAGTPGRRLIAESEVHPGSAASRAEANDSGVLQHGTGFAAPGDPLIGGLLGQQRIPLDGHSAGTTHLPVRAAVTPILHLPDMGHEQRKVFVVTPETVHLLDRGVDVKRFLNIHGPAPLQCRQSDTTETIPGTPHQHAGTERADQGADTSSANQAIERQQGAGHAEDGLSITEASGALQRRGAEALDIADASPEAEHLRSNVFFNAFHSQ